MTGYKLPLRKISNKGQDNTRLNLTLKAKNLKFRFPMAIERFKGILDRMSEENLDKRFRPITNLQKVL